MFDQFIDVMIPVAVMDSGIMDTAAQMIADNLHPDSTDCTRDGNHLAKYLHAVPIVFDHPGKSSYLPFYAVQPLNQPLLILVSSALCHFSLLWNSI